MIEELLRLIDEHVKEETVPVPMDLVVKMVFALDKLERIEATIRNVKNLN